MLKKVRTAALYSRATLKVAQLSAEREAFSHDSSQGT